MVGGKACQRNSKANGKVDSVQPRQPSKQPPLACPECRGKKLWRAGLRQIRDGSFIQRWLCRDCGYRVSEKNSHNSNLSSWKPSRKGSKQSLNRPSSITNSCQVCEALTEGTKNLTAVEPPTKWAAGATKQTAEIKGKILEFAWQLRKDGLSQKTIRSYVERLRTLLKKGAKLNEPESVKEIIALQDRWSKGTKYGTVQAYSRFAKFSGIHWKPPKYRPIRKKPFIPLEKELDALIACCGKKTSTLLQLLKETGMRIGEALKLEWTDVDFGRNVVAVNHPEKNGESRQIEVSNKLMAMLNRLRKKNNKVFGHITMNTAQSSFHVQRKHAAFKLQNPRLMQITFHTFRHWKATMEYHRTKDILHVMQLLGHRDINTTLIYTQLVSFKSNEFVPRRAKTKEEEDALIKCGFEFVRYDHTNKEAIYRKRK